MFRGFHGFLDLFFCFWAFLRFRRLYQVTFEQVFSVVVLVSNYFDKLIF